MRSHNRRCEDGRQRVLRTAAVLALTANRRHGRGRHCPGQSRTSQPGRFTFSFPMGQGRW